MNFCYFIISNVTLTVFYANNDNNYDKYIESITSEFCFNQSQRHGSSLRPSTDPKSFISKSSKLWNRLDNGDIIEKSMTKMKKNVASAIKLLPIN